MDLVFCEKLSNGLSIITTLDRTIVIDSKIACTIANYTVEDITYRWILATTTHNAFCKAFRSISDGYTIRAVDDNLYKISLPFVATLN